MTPTMTSGNIDLAWLLDLLQLVHTPQTHFSLDFIVSLW